VAYDYRQVNSWSHILLKNRTLSIRQDAHPNIDAAASRNG
jgi:hypothetical protein